MRTLESSLLVLFSSIALADGFQQAARLVVAPRSLSFASTTSLQVASVTKNNNDSSSSFGSSAATTSTTTLPARHVRWHSPAENTYHLQTAVTTWQNPTTGQKVELHAMVHFGDKDYYQEYNKNDASQDQNNRIVLYELLLDDTMLLTSSDGFRRVARPLGASLADQQTAARYNWACQVDVLDYQQPHWRHADWTRGEFQQALQKGRGNNKAAASAEPVWQQVSSPSAATEAATALFVGPPTMSDKDSRRRLFSNLFLPGSSLASALRLALWMTVPAPELSVLLLDWSSTTSSRNVWQASWSPIVRFLLQALQQARLDVIQRLAFGQVLLTGSRPTTTSTSSSSPNSVAQSLLIQGRNQQALKVLDQTLSQDKDADVALLYGSSHCPDLSQGLRQRGFVFQSTNWRTAWSVELNNNNNDAPAHLWLIPATLYLAASGADWLASWQAVASAGDDPSQILLLAGAYGVRHVLLYLGISKVVLDWQRPGGVVEE